MAAKTGVRFCLIMAAKITFFSCYEVSSNGERIHRCRSEDFSSLARHRISCNIEFSLVNYKLASLKRIQTKGLPLFVEQNKNEKLN